MKNWSVETIGKSVDDELEQLPVDMRVRFVRVTSLIEEFGPFNVGMPHIRSLGEKLWEENFTSVYRLEDDQWKVIHCHVSQTKPPTPWA